MPLASPISARWHAPPILVRGQASVVAVELERDGAALSGTVAGTLAVYDAEGAQVATAAAAFSGGVLSATVDAADTTGRDYSGDWMVVFTWTLNSAAQQPLAHAAVLAATDLACPIGTTDLTQETSQIATLAGGVANLQPFVSEAYRDLLNDLYAADCPYWKLRSTSTLRKYLKAAAAMKAFDSFAAAHRNGVAYDRVARRLEASLPALFAALRARIDADEENAVSYRASPVEVSG